MTAETFDSPELSADGTVFSVPSFTALAELSADGTVFSVPSLTALAELSADGTVFSVPPALGRTGRMEQSCNTNN